MADPKPMPNPIKNVAAQITRAIIPLILPAALRDLTKMIEVTSMPIEQKMPITGMNVPTIWIHVAAINPTGVLV